MKILIVTAEMHLFIFYETTNNFMASVFLNLLIQRQNVTTLPGGNKGNAACLQVWSSLHPCAIAPWNVTVMKTRLLHIGTLPKKTFHVQRVLAWPIILTASPYTKQLTDDDTRRKSFLNGSWYPNDQAAPKGTPRVTKILPQH